MFVRVVTPPSAAFSYSVLSVVASNVVLPDPIVSAGTLKAYALIGLHLLAATREGGSSDSQSPDSGDM